MRCSSKRLAVRIRSLSLSLSAGLLPLLATACGAGDPAASSPLMPGAASGDPTAATPTAAAPPSGAGGAGGAGGGGGATTGGRACAADPLSNCAGTMSGPWCVDHLAGPNQPTVNDFVTGIWSSAPDDVWATVSRNETFPATSGHVFHWDGCAWTESPLPGPEPALHAVWGAAANEVFIAGDHGTALLWDGKYWSPIPVGADVTIASLSGTSGTDLWASGGYHYDGTTWSLPAGGALVSNVWAVAPNDVWGVLGPEIVPHWDGTAWTPTRATMDPTHSLFAIWAGPGNAWAVGEGEAIARFENGVWSTVMPAGGSSQGFIGVMAEGADVYAVGIEIFHKAGAGSFVADKDAPFELYSSVWMTTSQVWVSGSDSVVLHRAR